VEKKAGVVGGDDVGDVVPVRAVAEALRVQIQGHEDIGHARL
jgi:hypothetical protein